MSIIKKRVVTCLVVLFLSVGSLQAAYAVPEMNLAAQAVQQIRHVTSAAVQVKYVEANGVKAVELPKKAEGKIAILGNTKNEMIKVLIRKGDKQLWYDVRLQEGEFDEEIWFIEGKGMYEVNIMVYLYDNKYRYGPRFVVENTEEINRFLVPTKDVESQNEKIVNLAGQITKGAKTDREKAKRIYDWVTNNIKYDYDKYRKHLAKDYNNAYGAIHTLETQKGVCYDYATLVAALGRAEGIQVKVIRGNFVSKKRTELHAWNEIYLPEENQWIKVDTTFGYTLNKNYFDNQDFDTDHEKLSEY